MPINHIRKRSPVHVFGKGTLDALV